MPFYSKKSPPNATPARKRTDSNLGTVYNFLKHSYRGTVTQPTSRWHLGTRYFSVFKVLKLEKYARAGNKYDMGEPTAVLGGLPGREH